MILPRAPLPAGAVGSHYDELDRWYRELWGEHLHHGLWDGDGDAPVAEATARLARRVADLARIGAGDRVADAGTGYGATARLLARERGASVTALTVSRAQHAWAASRPRRPGDPEYLLRDWLDSGLPAGAFDAVVAIESVSHMPDKAAAFAEAARVLRPGGRLVVCDWLARSAASRWRERLLLEPICREGRLPSMHTAEEYAALLEEAGLALEAFADWSRDVARTWRICLARAAAQVARDPEARAFLLSARNPDRVFALTMARLALAYPTRAMRYGVLVVTRPDA